MIRLVTRGGRATRARRQRPKLPGPARSEASCLRTGWRAAGSVVLLLAFVVTGLSAAPTIVQAHGAPTSLDFWGAFGRRTARCQRVIGRSAAVCALRAWDAHQTCRLALLHGKPCDMKAADDAAEAARLAAVDAVGDACTEQQVLTLTFLGLYEAQSDAVRFCRELDTAAISAVFDSLPDDPTTISPALRACVDWAALATGKLLRRAFESHERLLDRIALLPFAPRDKHAMVAASREAIAADAAKLEAAMPPSCSADEFRQGYGRDPAALLAQIASRADYLAGRTYAQNGIVCPPAQCGNGMEEPPDEDCDDGNLIGGDGCSPTCTRE